MMRAARALGSLELELPLLITSLLVLVIGAFGWEAYAGIRKETLAAAGQHLERVTAQLVASLTAGASQRAAEVRGPANQPAVQTYLVRPGGTARAAARAILQRLTSRSEEHTSELQSQFHLVCRL